METLAERTAAKRTTLDLWLANPVLGAAGRMECERLTSTCPAVAFPDGAELATAQEPADHVTLLLAGRARVFHRSADGREALVRLVEAPMLLGDAEVLGGVCWLENVAALGEVLVAQIPEREFCELLRRCPRAMLAQLGHMAASCCVGARDGRQVFAMLEQRVANLLLTLAERHGRTCPDGTALTPPLSLSDLARALGTIPRTVAKTVAGLTRKGMVRRWQGGFALLRPDALEAAASSMRHGLFYRMGMELGQLEQQERPVQLELVVLRGPGSTAGLCRPVEREVVIGWDGCCELRLCDDLVSRRHCRIYRASSGWRYWVDDLASETGTLVDGRPVTRAVLRGGERIQVGSTELLARVVHRDQGAELEEVPLAAAAR